VAQFIQMLQEIAEIGCHLETNDYFTLPPPLFSSLYNLNPLKTKYGWRRIRGYVQEEWVRENNMILHEKFMVGNGLGEVRVHHIGDMGPK